jgi:hypothetical protein
MAAIAGKPVPTLDQRQVPYSWALALFYGLDLLQNPASIKAVPRGALK